ncbi:hypothetical protein LCE31_37885, partial [Streptomyces sp. 8L]|nr:hypothetical protein [Streptomyces sp. 8L]
MRRWRPRAAALGRRRVRAALLLAALFATAVTALTSLPAYAQPSPSPTPSTSTAPTLPPPSTEGGKRPPTQAEIEQIQEALQEQNEVLSKTAQQTYREKKVKELRKLLPAEGGVLSVFNVTDSNGMPISAYDVSSDTGGVMDWEHGIENFFTEIAFMITKWVVAFACWLISWSLAFGLAKFLLTPATAVSNSLHTHVLMEMGLPSLFLTVCALICACRIFFGNRAAGWRDAAVSIVLAALTTTLLATIPQTLLGNDGALAAVRGLSLDVADVILDSNP